MNCQQVSENLSLSFNGRLSEAVRAEMEAHLASCTRCLAEWEAFRAVDRVLASAPVVAPPPGLPARVTVRIARREAVRCAFVGAVLLALGTVALGALLLAPALLDFVGLSRAAPALLDAGLRLVAQLLAVVGTLGRTASVLADALAPVLLPVLSSCLMIAVGLGMLWLRTVRRLAPVRVTNGIQ